MADDRTPDGRTQVRIGGLAREIVRETRGESARGWPEEPLGTVRELVEAAHDVAKTAEAQLGAAGRSGAGRSVRPELARNLRMMAGAINQTADAVQNGMRRLGGGRGEAGAPAGPEATDRRTPDRKAQRKITEAAREIVKAARGGNAGNRTEEPLETVGMLVEAAHELAKTAEHRMARETRTGTGQKVRPELPRSAGLMSGATNQAADAVEDEARRLTREAARNRRGKDAEESAPGAKHPRQKGGTPKVTPPIRGAESAAGRGGGAAEGWTGKRNAEPGHGR